MPDNKGITWQLQHANEKIVEVHGKSGMQKFAKIGKRVWVRRDNINSCQCKSNTGIKDWH